MVTGRHGWGSFALSTRQGRALKDRLRYGRSASTVRKPPGCGQQSPTNVERLTERSLVGQTHLMKIERPFNFAAFFRVALS
jgi:hypothetical protein